MTFSAGFLDFRRFSFTGYPIVMSSSNRLPEGISVSFLISFCKHSINYKF